MQNFFLEAGVFELKFVVDPEMEAFCQLLRDLLCRLPTTH